MAQAIDEAALRLAFGRLCRSAQASGEGRRGQRIDDLPLGDLGAGSVASCGPKQSTCRQYAGEATGDPDPEWCHLTVLLARWGFSPRDVRAATPVRARGRPS